MELIEPSLEAVFQVYLQIDVNSSIRRLSGDEQKSLKGKINFSAVVLGGQQTHKYFVQNDKVASGKFISLNFSSFLIYFMLIFLQY